MKCHRRFKMQALTHWDASITSTRTAVGQFKRQFKGAMEEMSQKVQNASSHPSILCTHKAHDQFSWAMDEMSQKVQNASTHPTGTQTSRARAQQLVSSRVSSRGRWMECLRRFNMQTLTICGTKIMSTRTAAGQFKGQFKGAMEEMSQNVQNASSHPSISLRTHKAHG